MQFKAPIQRFDLFQKIVVLLSFSTIIGFIYYHIFKTETKTYMGKKIQEYFMTQKDWQELYEREYEQDEELFENEEF